MVGGENESASRSSLKLRPLRPSILDQQRLFLHASYLSLTDQSWHALVCSIDERKSYSFGLQSLEEVRARWYRAEWEAKTESSRTREEKPKGAM